MNDIEVWKSYPSIEWLQGSNLGNVRTVDRVVVRKDGRKQFVKGRVLKQQRNKNGYMYVGFRANGKAVYLRVHRVIAMCFLPNPNNYPQVNHKDCNPSNNTVSNLEWCTASYNCQYREKYGVSATEARWNRIIAVNLKTLEVNLFPSQMEAARRLGANHGHINSVLIGRLNKHHGYWFTNADNYALEKVRAKFGDSVASKVEKLLNKED